MMEPSDKQLEEILRELTDGEPEFTEELITAYIDNLQEFCTDASLAVRNQDLNQLKNSLHKINPTMLALGYKEGYEELTTIKTRLDYNLIEENLNIVEKVTHRILSQLQRMKNK